MIWAKNFPILQESENFSSQSFLSQVDFPLLLFYKKVCSAMHLYLVKHHWICSPEANLWDVRGEINVLLIMDFFLLSPLGLCDYRQCYSCKKKGKSGEHNVYNNDVKEIRILNNFPLHLRDYSQIVVSDMVKIHTAREKKVTGKCCFAHEALIVTVWWLFCLKSLLTLTLLLRF